MPAFGRRHDSMRYGWAVAALLLLGPVVGQAHPAQPIASTLAATASAESPAKDSLWLVSTRHLTNQVCWADLEQPAFRVYQLDACGRRHRGSLEQLLSEETPAPLDLIYIHGNRMPADQIVTRALFVYRHVVRYRPPEGPPIRFLIWSWPSEQQGLALRDVRIKAARTDAQGLYLAWLMREQLQRGRRQRLVGFSFGGRVATGALHALAGGTLARRGLPGETIQGAGIGVGLLAPAIGEDWLSEGRKHGRATKNIAHLTLLFNRRDAVLKRYPLLDPVSGVEALGFRGPRSFGRRLDGSPVPLIQMNCSDTVGLQHSEEAYYTGRCRAGCRIYAMTIRHADEALSEN